MRHEQVVILVLAYVIGFTTAFIAFGLNQEDQSLSTNSVTTVSVVEASPESGSTQEAAARIEYEDVHLDEQGLYIERNEEVVFVSAPYTDGVEPGAGYHVSVDAYVLADDGTTLHYCAKETPEDEKCNRYEYNILAHTVRVE